MNNLLRNIDWDETPDLKKVFLAGIILAIIIYADCAFLLFRQADELKRVCSKVNKLSGDISAGSKEMRSSAPVNPAVTGRETSRARLLRFGDLPRLLKDISDVSLRNNLKIMQVVPQGEASPSRDASSAAKLPAVNISLELSGRFYDTVKFINELENGRYFVQIQDLKIRRSKNDYTLQDIGLLLRVYVNK
ncbi:MAG: type 4a pilus biogenesis protein PilO [Candidatus Omnitrophota bacterium]|jgi:Tfp pilus assembly protein PilO